MVLHILLGEAFIYLVHRGSHWLARWRIGRRVAVKHLSHHANHFEKHPYDCAETSRKALEFLVLGFLRFLVSCRDEGVLTALAMLDTAMLYKLAHTLQHISPPGTPIRDHHRLHHRRPKYNLGILTPCMDVLLGNLHPSQSLRTGWRVLLLPIPILGFWALETTTTTCP